LLNELIKYPEGLFLLNNYVALTCTTYVKETLKRTGTPKKYGIVLKKISNWAKDNIMQIFLTVPFIDENFFLVPLMYFPKISLPDQKIIQVIHDYLVQIKKTISGEKFLDLLKEEDPELYAIILSDASMTSGIKDVIAEEKNKLITKE